MGRCFRQSLQVVSSMTDTPKLNRLAMATLCVMSLIGAGYVDYVTGFDLVFSAIYLVPSCMCAWFFGRRAVALISIASATVSWNMDSGHPYSNPSIQYWNAFSCFLVSFFGGLMLFRLKQILAERKQINSDLKNAMEELKRSTEEITKLQQGLQVVCAWTQRIKVGDQWMSPDEFLSSQLHLKITHGISPEGRQKFVDESKLGSVLR